MIDISVIVPLYRGKKYIPQVISQIEGGSRACSDLMVELLFINDCPDEHIETVESDEIMIKVYNTKINRGIQRARIRGCELAQGEYVLMLDQDDEVKEEYFKSQLLHMKSCNADASVCKALDEKRELYNESNPFCNVKSLEYLINTGNPIVSPGQVLMRKDAISQIWKEGILKYNGADDWLLWISMLAEGKKFVLNDAVLYEHIVNGENASLNTQKMLLSQQNVCEVICSTNILNDSEKTELRELINKEHSRYITLLEKFRQMFFLYEKWMRAQKRISIDCFLKKMGYKRIAVYGLGYLGRQMVYQLSNTDVEIVCAIDQNAASIGLDVPLCTLEEFHYQVDLVIVTVLGDTTQIIEALNGFMTNVVILNNLLDIWEKE